MSEIPLVGRLFDFFGVPLISIYQDERGMVATYNHILDLWTFYGVGLTLVNAA